MSNVSVEVLKFTLLLMLIISINWVIVGGGSSIPESQKNKLLVFMHKGLYTIYLLKQALSAKV